MKQFFIFLSLLITVNLYSNTNEAIVIDVRSLAE